MKIKDLKRRFDPVLGKGREKHNALSAAMLAAKIMPKWWELTHLSQNWTSLGAVPQEQKMLKGHPPRVIYDQVY